MKLRIRLRDAAAREDGFTIIEVVVSMLIFVIVITAAVITMVGALNLTRNDRSRSVAANLASQQVDTIQQDASSDFSGLPVGQTILTQTVDGTPYTITQDLEWQSSATQTGACTTVTASSLAFLHVQETVSWPNMRGTVPVTSETLLTPPVGTYDPSTGHIAVQVFDRNAVAKPNVLVTLSGPGVSDTQFTTSDGCAFFAYLDPGNYTVALSGIGFVDGQGNVSPTQNAAVVAGSITSLQFNYDLASSILVTFGGPSGSTLPASMPLTNANSLLLPDGTIGYAPGAMSRTITNLYPYLNGYQVWAGDCADSDPGAKRIASLAMTPGAPSTASVTLPSALVVVQKASGPFVAGATLVLVHPADTQCGTADSLTYTSTNASGQLSVAVPYGTWTVQVPGQTANVSTTITGGSNNVALPTSTINVVSTTGFSVGSTVWVTTSAGVQSVTCTGTTATTFTGCTGGTGTMTSGQAVSQWPTVQIKNSNNPPTVPTVTVVVK